MDQVVMLVASAPAGTAADSAFGIAWELRKRGRRCHIVLLQDAVLAAVSGGDLPACRALGSAVAAGCDVQVIGDDLQLRGLERKRLVDGARVIDYDDLVELMTLDGVQTRGVF